MILRFRDATLGDVPAIAAIQNAASGALTARFGAGPWSTLMTEREAASARRRVRVVLAFATVALILALTMLVLLLLRIAARLG